MPKLSIAQMAAELALKSKPRNIVKGAERQANLNRFLEGNHPNLPSTMYHGTGEDFSTFDINKTSEKSKLGKGIYLAPTTTKANNFAMIRKLQGDAPSVMPVYASIKNPYEIHGLDNIPINQIDTKKLQDLGHDGIFLYDNKGNLQESVAFDPTQVKSAIGNEGTFNPEESDITKADGGIVKKAISIARKLPPPENAQRTQIIGTLPTYEKARLIFEANKAKGKAIDYGAGLGEGAKILKAHTYEPYAKDWTPTFTKPEDIPDEAYGKLTNLNVLNVVPREIRDEMVLDMGRVMRPKSHGIITTRGKDVMNAQGEEGPEPMSVITSRDTYQKGFTPNELEEYLRYMLGDDFDINKINLGPAGAMIQKKATGGVVKMSIAGDAAKQAVKQGVKKAKKMSPEFKAEMDATRLKELNPITRDVTAPMRAEAGRKAAEYVKKQPQVKLSEALGNLNVEGKKNLSGTITDRTRVGGGNIGGALFSTLGQVDENYAPYTWGVRDKGTASRLINLTDSDTIWTTILGGSDQLKSNPVVFDRMKRQFMSSMKKGNMSPELTEEYNKKLVPIFGEGADIRDPELWKMINSFEKRGAVADLMLGKTVGGKKGQIFDADKLLFEETEPSLLHPEMGGTVETYEVGPRLFTFSGEQSYRPDLHTGFPTLLHGEDLGYNLETTPSKTVFPSWHEKWAESVAKENEEKVLKGKSPRTSPIGYMDYTRGIKDYGLPTQPITEEFLTWLQKNNFKDGGQVQNFDKGGNASVTIEGLKYEPETTYTDPMGMSVPSQDEMRLAISKQNMSPMPQSEPYRDPVTGAILDKGLEALPPGSNIPKTGGMTPIDWENLPEEEKERTIGDRVAGLLETGTTLGTGMLAFPYAFGKGLMSGDFNKTFEDTMAKNLYIPRDKGGIENLEILGKGLEASKLPPLIPELHGLEPIISAATKSGIQLGAKGIKEGFKATKGLPLGLSIKDVGGNWLEKDLRQKLIRGDTSKQLDETFNNEKKYARKPDPSNIEDVLKYEDYWKRRKAEHDKEVALRKWEESNLMNYVKNQMGTKDDPIRQVWDKGYLHVDEKNWNYDDIRAPNRLKEKRWKKGFPTEGHATTEKGKIWENMVDRRIMQKPASELAKHEYFLQEHPWLANKNPNEEINYLDIPGGLHLDKLVNQVRKALNRGDIKPEDVPNYKIADAVKSAHNEINANKKKQLEESSIGLPVKKDYDDGYKWVELYHPNKEKTRDVLASEGEFMGHCVGDYAEGEDFDDIMSQSKRIYSLRDANGEPHITIEVNKPSTKKVSAETYLEKYASDEFKLRHPKPEGFYGSMKQLMGIEKDPEYIKWRSEYPNRISQIKGKKNTKPKEEYEPYIADFLGSGNWSDIKYADGGSVERIRPMFLYGDYQGVTKMNEGGSVADREIAKMKEITEKAMIRRELGGGERVLNEFNSSKPTIEIKPIQPVNEHLVNQEYNARRTKPTVALEPIGRGGSRIPSTQLELFKKKGGNVSIDEMRLALMRNR
jgi:hypothetical protein